MSVRNKLVCSGILVLFLFTSLIFVMGEEDIVTVQPEETYTLILEDLHMGKGITWDWDVDEYSLDFWIEDPSGTAVYEVFDEIDDTGSMNIPESGDWTLNWENTNLISLSIDYSIELTYTVEIVNHLPTAHIEVNVETGKTPLNVSFTGSGLDTDGDVVSYMWDFDDGDTSDLQNTFHIFESAGEYNVTLTVHDDDDAEGMDFKVITVVSNVPPTANIVTDKNDGLAPLQVTFEGAGEDEDGNVVSYHWDFDDGETSEDQNVAHIFENAGVYNVVLSVTDDNGDMGTDSVQIIVTPVRPKVTMTSPEDGDVDVNVGTDIMITFDIPMNIINTADNLDVQPVVAYTITWSNGNREMTIAINTDLAYETEYTISLGSVLAETGGIIEGDGYTFSFTTEVEPPVKDITVQSPSIGTEFEPGETITVTGSTNGFDPGTTVEVTIGSQTATGTIADDGTWSVEITAPEDEGENTISVTIGTLSENVLVNLEEKDKDTNYGIFIGIIVAILIFLVVGIIIFFILKSKKDKEEEVPESPEVVGGPEETYVEENVYGDGMDEINESNE